MDIRFKSFSGRNYFLRNSNYYISLDAAFDRLAARFEPSPVTGGKEAYRETDETGIGDPPRSGPGFEAGCFWATFNITKSLNNFIA
jgi:hypothetical protein